MQCKRRIELFLSGINKSELSDEDKRRADGL